MCLFMCLHFDISSVLEFNKFLNFDFKIKCFFVIQRSQFCPPEYAIALLKIFQLIIKFAGPSFNSQTFLLSSVLFL